MNPFKLSKLKISITLDDYINSRSYRDPTSCLLAMALRRIFNLNAGDVFVTSTKVIFYRKNAWFWQKRYKEFRLKHIDDRLAQMSYADNFFVPFEVVLESL